LWVGKELPIDFPYSGWPDSLPAGPQEEGIGVEKLPSFSSFQENNEV